MALDGENFPLEKVKLTKKDAVKYSWQNANIST